MRFLVLGAAAGGGLPQWNCGCRNCVDARAGRIAPATQSSLAVSLDGRDWAVLNASPDIRSQMQHCPQMHPRGPRDTPLASVLLTNGDIDHIAGLLSLREQTPFVIHATGEILALLAANRVFDALSPGKVSRRHIAMGSPFPILPGLMAEIFAVPGKIPLFMEEGPVRTDLMGEQTVGVRLSDGAKTACYIPGCADVTDGLIAQLGDVDHLFFDGTLWSDDEMIRAGLGAKTGRRMGHVPISGPDGSISRLAGLRAGKTFVHINNTNPVWRPDSPERALAQAQGWQIAFDGMEVAI
ncbi:pyrroloquinoline quinone biosynthesis protein PqqB [Paracoccus sp. (in: a-proteobacteria)]|uniref:pyrroloquinoline quinone biosynthesis protein PqqB n=1 Tax=Paracoccus sp. TaxID=267 RepID=UPI003A860FE0